MKFTSVGALEKNLKESHHLAPIYLIADASEYERKKLIDRIGKSLNVSRIIRLNAETPIEAVKNEILSPNLWGETLLVVYDGVDKVKGLDQLFFHFPSHVFLIVGTSGFKPVSELYQKGKKEIVALDLSGERPWEHERRVKEWLFERVKEEGKRISSDGVQLLLDTLGSDVAALDPEITKLLCYIGEKEVIALTDIQAICSTRDLATGWQLAEKIVWDRPVNLAGKLSDHSFLFPFLGQLRYHFQLGYQIAEQMSKKPHDLKHHFPAVRNLEKLAPIAKVRRPSFFSRGLQSLFELELAAKSTGADIGVLFDLFQAKIYENSLSASQPAS